MTYRTPSPRSTRLRVAARTDVGPMRYHNEDGFVVADLSLDARDAGDARSSGDAYAGVIESASGVALASIDGMGGARTGDRATRIIVEAFPASLRGAPADDEGLRRRLATAMSDASHAILEAAKRDRSFGGCGAVAVLAVVAGDRLHVASAGDSRAYLLRAGRLVQITRDDSLINDARTMAPEMTEEQLAELPANVVTKGLGFSETLSVTPSTFPLCAGDVLLLCSDGLWAEVGDEVIERVLVDLPDPAEACLALLNRAIKAGGNDNITVIVARPEIDSLREPGPGDVIESRNPPPFKPASRGTG